MDRSAKFWDKIAKKYSKQPIADEASYKKKLEITRGYFNPDMELLEIGCGTGSTAILHAPHVKHIRAVDISARMIEIAKGKAEAEQIDNVSFEQAGIDELNMDDQSLDMVLALSILHLVENKEDVLAKLYKMLKPGGVLVTSTACLADMNFLIRLILPIGYFLRFFPMVQVFSGNDLEKSVTGAGFEIEHNWRPGKNKAVFIVARKPG